VMLFGAPPRRKTRRGRKAVYVTDC
jgi:hypothetical protein